MSADRQKDTRRQESDLICILHGQPPRYANLNRLTVGGPPTESLRFCKLCLTPLKTPVIIKSMLTRSCRLRSRLPFFRKNASIIWARAFYVEYRIEHEVDIHPYSCWLMSQKFTEAFSKIGPQLAKAITVGTVGIGGSVWAFQNCLFNGNNTHRLGWGILGCLVEDTD